MVKVNIHSDSVSICKMVRGRSQDTAGTRLLWGQHNISHYPRDIYDLSPWAMQSLGQACLHRRGHPDLLASRYAVVWLDVCDGTKVSANLCLARVLYGALLERTSVVALNV